MREAFIMDLLKDLRSQITETIASVPSSRRRMIPEGLNNHLHWQLGHILTVTDGLIFQMAGLRSRIPDSYPAFFATGTSPSDWKEEPPQWDELMRLLQDQLPFILTSMNDSSSKDRLDWSADVPDNPLGAKYVSELFGIWIAHESMHAGMVKAMAMSLN